MASSRLFTSRTVPYLSGAALLATAGTTYYATRRPLLLDSAQNAPTSTLSFPKTMLFSQQLTLTQSEQINHDTRRITFSLPGGNSQVSGVPAGSAVLTQHTPKGAWFPVFRPYTPVSNPEERGTIQFVVKQYPKGKASTHMHSLEPGQTLLVRGPIPGYTYKPSTQQPRDVICIAGGAGITPIFSLAKGILSRTDDQTKIQLLWGVNGTRDIVLKNELEILEKQFPGRLQVTYCVSGPEAKADSPSLGDEAKWRKGYVDKSVIAQAVGRCQNLGDEKGTKVFLCGPPAMEKAVPGILAELGIEKKGLHKF